MQKKKNDVKARTTLLLSLPDEHQLRFSKSDLDTMSLDDLYNHLKVYESEVQKKLEPNSQNMAFISLAKHSSGNEDANTACVPTASTNIPTASASVATISQNMALLSMRAGKFWKKTGKKISIQGSDVAGFDKSKMKERQLQTGSKAEEQAPKALMEIEFALMANTSDESKVFDNSLCSKDCKKNNDSQNSKIIDLTDKLFDANNLIYHYKLALAQVESRLVEYKEREVKYCEKIKTLEFHNESHNECIDILKKKLKTLKVEKEGVNGKLAGLLKASKDLDNLIESQRLDKNKDGIGYSAVPPPPAQLYLSPKKDLSWTGLPECADDTVTDYSRPSPTVESKTESPKKPPVKYAEQYRKPNKKSNVRGNQRNWNNLKTHQLGPDFVMKKKACFNCGEFNHLAYDCRKSVRKSFTPKPVAHRPYRPSQRPVKTNMNGARPNRSSFNKQAHSYANRLFHRTSAVRSPHRAPWVPTVNRNFPPVNRKFSPGSRNFPTGNRKFPTASRKFPIGSTNFSTADMGMKGKAVKPSACWFWKPSQNLSIKGPKNNNVSVMSKKYTYIDTQGILKSMMAWVPKEN
uniref:Ribonuclease H-like domain-containing protein n=1 Tax=Tanacetum cinerariifolium TaxID=118510 RepID=A0A699J3N9_TANCI|nr:ribonuclease H-like domain-containing protein [Tanacetum cinerariifolium]